MLGWRMKRGRIKRRLKVAQAHYEATYGEA